MVGGDTLPTAFARLHAGVTPERVRFYLGPLLLAWVAALVYLNSTSGVLDRHDRVRGRDFLGLYVHGHILAEGGGAALYDPEHFRQVQESFASLGPGRPRYYPLYPPAAALLFVPLSNLPYESALYVWWAIQGGCFAVAFAWLFVLLRPAPEWRTAALLALAAHTAVFSTMLNGQLTAVLLLIVLAGFALHGQGWPFWAGCVLSLLTLKPQLAVGPVLWFVLRRDWCALCGFAVGTLAQTGTTAAVVGVEVFVGYVQNLKTYLELARVESNTADHQHALAGVVRNLLGPEWADLSKLLHTGVVFVAAGLLWRVRTQESRMEYSAVLLFTLLAAPHLLTYDLALLLPVCVWLCVPVGGDRPPERVALAVALYLAGAAAPLYHFTGFSVVPLILLGGLFVLARFAQGPEDASCRGAVCVEDF